MNIIALKNDQKPDGQPLDNQILERQIVELSAHIHAATYRLLILIERFDRENLWANGFKNCAHWLSFKTGLNLGAARQKVKVARALPSLPHISHALEHGQISYAKARALVRIATKENEFDLLQIAKQATSYQVEKMVRLMRQSNHRKEIEKETQAIESRALVTYFDEDQMYVIRGKVPKEMGAVIQKALDVACNELCDENKEPYPAKQADALLHVAKSALDHKMNTGSGADQVQVVVHVEETVLKNPEQNGLSTIENQMRVSAETSKRLCCDATIQKVSTDKKGNPLFVGRKKRVISNAMRTALTSRDKQCQVPGCSHNKHLQAHHIKHWADGGKTNLDNLVLLCSFHHRALHQEKIHIKQAKSGRLIFTYDKGTPMTCCETQPRGKQDLAETLFKNQPYVCYDSLPSPANDKMDYDIIRL